MHRNSEGLKAQAAHSADHKAKTRKLCYRKDDRAMRVDREPFWRYGHSKLSKMAAAVRIENSAIRSAVPENPTL